MQKNVNIYRHLIFFCMLSLSACHMQDEKIDEIGTLAKGWKGEIIAEIDQSYAGWDVEIGDADNDGLNEILITGCPDSRLYLLKKIDQKWKTKLLADKLAHNYPGMGLVVKVLDLNSDGQNEIIVGTGQETGETAFFYTFQMKSNKLVELKSIQPESNKSSYTHNFASFDVDKDGLLEVFSAYCGGGEIIRYDFDRQLNRLNARKIHQLSGSGEESLISDVDNDGKVEFITSNSYRHENAKIEIFEFADDGELEALPRITINGFGDNKCFYASAIIGDIDNDSRNELIVGWKKKQDINVATILGYRIDKNATPLYTFAYEDESLDLGYFEKMMVVADADNDGKNELVVSTRGDELSEKVSTSKHLGHVYLYSVNQNADINRELLVNFNEKVGSSWIDVGDADHDQKNEIIIATGKGDRTKPGISHVVLVEKESFRIIDLLRNIF